MTTTARALPKEVQATVASYLELAPGVDATPRNLKLLLEHTRKCGFYKAQQDGVAITITNGKRKRMPVLVARLEGPVAPRGCYRLILCQEDFAADEDGLLAAIVFLKRAVQRYRTDGVCEKCKHEYNMRLKAEGMPACERCVLADALGI